MTPSTNRYDKAKIHHITGTSGSHTSSKDFEKHTALQ